MSDHTPLTDDPQGAIPMDRTDEDRAEPSMILLLGDEYPNGARRVLGALYLYKPVPA